MHYFEGYLTHYEVSERKVSARFVSGVLAPSDEDPPVLELEITPDFGASERIAALSELEDEAAWVYITSTENDQINIETEFGLDFSVRGKVLRYESLQYNANDLRLLALKQSELVEQGATEIRGLAQKISRLNDILNEQLTRISIKATGHAIGSTARTLYEQQISLLERLRAETEA